MLSKKIAAKAADKYNEKRMGYQYVRLTEETFLKVHSSYDIQRPYDDVILLTKKNVYFNVSFLMENSLKVDLEDISNERAELIVNRSKRSETKSESAYYNNQLGYLKRLTTAHNTVVEFHYIRSGNEIIEVMIEHPAKLSRRIAKELQEMLCSVGESGKVKFDMQMLEMDQEEQFDRSVGDTYDGLDLKIEDKKRYEEKLLTHNMLYVFFILALPMLSLFFNNELVSLMKAFYGIPEQAVLITGMYIIGGKILSLLFFSMTLGTLLEYFLVKGDYRRYIAHNVPSKRHLQKKSYPMVAVGMLIFGVTTLLLFDSFSVLSDEGIVRNKLSTLGSIENYSYEEVVEYDFQLQNFESKQEEVIINQTLRLRDETITQYLSLDMDMKLSPAERYNNVFKKLEMLSQLATRVDEEKVKMVMEVYDKNLGEFILEKVYPE